MTVLAPGLSGSERQRVADVIRRIGGVPRGQIASTFMDADVSAARGLDPRAPDLHAEACAIVAPILATEHAIDIVPAAWCCGFAIGLRLGRTFGRVRNVRRFLERNEEDSNQPTRRIEKLIVLVSDALGEPDPERAAARRWAREMSRAAGRARP